MEVGKNPFERSKTIDLYANSTINQTSDLQLLDNNENAGSIFKENATYSDDNILTYEILDENDISIIEKELQRYVGELKNDLKNSQNTKGFLSSIGNGIAELFGKGDKGKETQIQGYEKLLNELAQNPQNILEVYQEIKGVELSGQDLNNLKIGNFFVTSLDQEVQNAVIEEFENQINELESNFEDIKSQNGWISGTWDAIKNIAGIGASSNKTQAEIDSMKKQIEALKNGETDLATAYKNITGEDLTQEEFESFANGEKNLIENSQAGKSVNKYSEGQKMCTDVVADMASGIIAVGAVAAAPFTGGSSLAALALAGGVGAVLKVGIKASDCIGNEKTYELKDGLYDVATGFVNGAMGPLTNGLGGAAGTGIAKAFGLKAVQSTAKEGLEQVGKTIIKESAEEVLEQGVKQAGKSTLAKILAMQGSEYVLKEGAEATLKTTIGKIAAYGVDMMVDGSLSGAADGAIRAVAEGRPEDILSDTISGLVGGAIAAPIIGGGMRGATKLGGITKNYANDLIDGFDFAEKAYNNPIIKKISKNFTEFSPELEPVVSFLATDEQFNQYISKKGIKEELQNLIYMLKSTNYDSFDDLKTNLKANITSSDVSQTVASDSMDMLERIVVNLKDISSGSYAPSGEIIVANSTEDLAKGLYLKFRAETQDEIQALYKKTLTDILDSVENIPSDIKSKIVSKIDLSSQTVASDSMDMLERIVVNLKDISSGSYAPSGEIIVANSTEDLAKGLYLKFRAETQDEIQALYKKTLTDILDSVENIPSDIKSKIVSKIDLSSQTVASDSMDMLERIVVNLKDISSGSYAPSGEIIVANSKEDLAKGLYLKFRAETQDEIQALYKNVTEETSDLVMDSLTMPNSSDYFYKEITEDDVIKQYQKIIELFGVGPTKMAQNLSGDDTKMADFFIKLIQKIDDSSFDLSNFDIDKQMSYIQQAMKNTKSGCSFTRTEEDALTEFRALFPEKEIRSVKKMSAASIGETFLANCDDGTEEGVNIIIKAIKNGISQDSLEEENNLIAHVITSIADDEQQEQADELVKMLNSLYHDFAEELDFRNEAHANSLLKETLERSKVAEVLSVSNDGRALTMELAQGVQANKLMAILKTYKNDLEYREAIDSMISEYKIDPNNFQLEKYLDESVYEKRIGVYAKILKDYPAMSEPIEIMRKLPNAEISSFCEQMIFIKKIDDGTGTIMHGDPHSGNFFINFDENGNPIMQYIDTGNVVTTNSENVTNNLKFFLNYFTGDTDGMAEYLLNNCNNMVNNLDLSPEELKKYISEKIKDEIFSVNLDGEEIGQNVTKFNEIYESITTLLNNLGLSINAESANYYKAQGMFLDAISDSTSLLGDSGFSVYSIIKDCPEAVVKMIQNNVNPMELIKSVLSFVIKNPKESIGNMWQFVLSERKNIKTVQENIAVFK